MNNLEYDFRWSVEIFQNGRWDLARFTKTSLGLSRKLIDQPEVIIFVGMGI